MFSISGLQVFEEVSQSNDDEVSDAARSSPRACVHSPKTGMSG